MTDLATKLNCGLVSIKMTTHAQPLHCAVAEIQIGRDMVFFFGPEEEGGARECVANPPAEWLEWFTLTGPCVKIMPTDSYAKRP